MKTREELKKILEDGTQTLTGIFWLGTDAFKAKFNKGKNIGTSCIFIGEIDFKGDINKQRQDNIEYLLDIIYN